MIPRILRYAVVAAALAYLGVYLVLAWHRLPYPFELEWMEGSSVDHVARVLRHEGLYVRPQLDFVPSDYTPLYFYVSAAVARVWGIGLFPLRLVSFLSSLVCFASLYAIVEAETRAAFPAVLAVGLFAATFRIGGAWLDVARVDSLFLALFLLAVLVVRRRQGRLWYLFAGLLLALSFLTKQTALAMALPMVLYVAFANAPLGICLAGSLMAVVGISTVLLNRASDGWYNFYVFALPFMHAWVKPVFVSFWTRDLLAPLPIAVTATALHLLRGLRLRGASVFWLMASAGMVGGAYRSRLQTGGYDNVLLPAYAAVAILAGLAVGACLRAVRDVDPKRKPLAEAAVYAACLGQLALLRYDPRRQLPGTADRAAGASLVQTLSRVKGEVFVPCHGYLPALAGKRTYAHLMPTFDVLKIGKRQSEILAEEHRQAIRQTRFDAIVLDEGVGYVFMPEVERYYVARARLFDDPGVFFPVTGAPTRPQYVYVPRGDAAGARE